MVNTEDKTNVSTTAVDADTLKAFIAWEAKQASKKVSGSAKRMATAALVKRHQPEFDSMKKFATENPGVEKIPSNVK